ncbi:MAG: class I SAM-dependent methyltransferase [Vicinamibacterales bacterium]
MASDRDGTRPGATARYVTDVPYVASFTAELAPAWLDAVATINGVAKPNHGGAVRWCELGCGPGLAPLIFAATHPDGLFHGIDLMPDHIARGRAIATDAGLGNVTLHALDFADACDLDLPAFDYIVAHGVYAWIDDAATAAMRRFIDRHLAPGGLVYVSYNAMPGWAADAPFQHLVRALADGAPGTSLERFAAAAATVQALRASGAPPLESSPIASTLDDLRARRYPAYFPHEYLAPAWRPRYVDEMRRDMATIGLTPVGSATLRDNFDRLVVTAAGRQTLDAIADPDQRELARDFLMTQAFRRDVYGRAPARIDDATRRARLFDGWLALVQPASTVRFSMSTEAGEVPFDTPVARGLVARLADGPARLRDGVTADTTPDGLLSAAIALMCAGVVRPVAAQAVSVDRINDVLARHLDARTGPTYRVLPRGTAVAAEHHLG